MEKIYRGGKNIQASHPRQHAIVARYYTNFVAFLYCVSYGCCGVWKISFFPTVKSFVLFSDQHLFYADICSVPGGRTLNVEVIGMLVGNVFEKP